MSGMHILFLFLDGVGLGTSDPAVNPFVQASMPNLTGLLDKRALTNGQTFPIESSRATLLSLDARMGVKGLPQSATGQAVLLTGRNIPAEIGYHYGPKPNPEVAAYLQAETLFHQVRSTGKQAALLSGYPPRYFEAIESGKRLFSAIPLAASKAGVSLHGPDDIASGLAIPADFTGHGWNQQPGFPKIPGREPAEAGKLLADLGMRYDFAFFEYWLSDYAGHGQDMPQAVRLLEVFDGVLGGLLDAWDDEQGLIVITSDHGNLEDLGTRRHTAHPVPGLLVGAPALRQRFLAGNPALHDLTGIAPRILRMLQ